MKEIMQATMIGVTFSNNSIDKSDYSKPSNFLLARAFINNGITDIEYKLVTYHQLRVVLDAKVFKVTNLNYNKQSGKISVASLSEKRIRDYTDYPCFRDDTGVFIHFSYQRIKYLMLIAKTHTKTKNSENDKDEYVFSQLDSAVDFNILRDIDTLKHNNTVFTKDIDTFVTIGTYKKYINRYNEHTELTIVKAENMECTAQNRKEVGFKKLERFMDSSQYENICKEYGIETAFKTVAYDKAVAFIDPDCRVIYIPTDVARLDIDPNFYDKYNGTLPQLKLEEIHVGNTIRGFVNKDFFMHCQGLKDVYYDAPVKTANLEIANGAFKDINVHMASTVNSVEYHRPLIADIDYRQFPHIKSISDSYVKCKISENFNLGHVEKVGWSLTDIETPFDLVIPNTVESLMGVQRCKLHSLQFEKGSRLKTIGMASFIHIESDIDTIELPDSIKSIESDAFSDWKSLKNIKLPSSLVKLGKGCFSNTQITELVIPESLDDMSEFNNDKITLKFKAKREIPARILSDVTAKEVKFEDTVEIFGRHSLNGGNFVFNAPSSLRYIERYALSRFQPPDEMGILDLSDTQITYIGESAFESSHFQRIILPDTLQKIDRRAFRQMSALKWIYLPPSLTEIGQLSFQNTLFGDPNSLAYVVKGSKADSFCKRSKIRVKYITCIDDIYKDIGIDRAGERKLSKLRMILGSDPLHSELFNQRYKDNILQLHSLYIACTQVLNNTIELDTTKFYKSNSGLTDLISKEALDKLTNENFKTETCNINQLHSYLNMLTHFMECDRELLDKDSSKKIYSAMKLKSAGYKAYTDSIQVIEVNLQYQETTYSLVYIRIDGKVVWASMIKTIINKVFPDMPYTNKDMHGMVELKLDIGQPFPVNSYVNSLVMPIYISKALRSVILEQMVFIGFVNVKPPMSKYEACQAYLYSTVSNNIILANISLDDISDVSMDDISTGEVISVTNINELGTSMFNRIVKSAFDKSGVKQTLNMILHGNDFLRELCLAEGAYDTPAPCFEWELSDALLQLNLSKPEMLNEKALSLILTSSYFKSGKLKRSTLYKAVDKTDRSEIVCGNGRFTVISYYITRTKQKKIPELISGKKQSTITVVRDSAIDDSDLDDSVQEQVYYSSDLFITIFKRILKLADKTAKNHSLVDNEMVDISDFVQIGKPADLSISVGPGIFKGTLRLAINKNSGVVFLLGAKNIDYTNLNWYKLFRYRDTKEALKSCSWLYNLHDSNPLLTQSISNRNLAELILNVSGSPAKYEDNKLIEIRNAMLNGAPNGFNTGLKCQEFYDSIAKQPRRQ